MKYSNYLSCGYVWFSSIWMFNSWILLKNSTKITFPFLITLIILIWIVDVFLFTLLLPTWCQFYQMSPKRPNMMPRLPNKLFGFVFMVKECQDQFFWSLGWLCTWIWGRLKCVSVWCQNWGSLFTREGIQLIGVLWLIV